MSALMNSRRERFAQAFAEGKSAKAAYIAAGYRARSHAAESEASRLMRIGEVADRIAELQSIAARRTTKTLEDIVSDLEIARLDALKYRNQSAAVSASAMQAKLLGYSVDRREVEMIERKPMRAPGHYKQMSM